jgi:AraC-like DNA-binding protein
MSFKQIEIDTLNKLVGYINEDTADRMYKNLECFIYPKVSLFIPSCGQCKYAVTPRHTHPAYTFIYYFQPIHNFVVEEEHMAYDLAGGKCLSAMSPGIAHQEIEEEYFQSYIAIAIEAELFNGTMLQYIQSVPVFRGEIFVPHPELLSLLRCFMLETSNSEDKNLEVVEHLASVITHMVVRSIVSGTQNTIALYDRFEVDRTIAYMNSHFSDKITVEELAQRVNLSTGHFSKIFKSVTGEAPIDFLNSLRLQKARNMLMNRMGNITEISIGCGFNSPSYFASCFLEKYKMTPSAYRQKFIASEKA